MKDIQASVEVTSYGLMSNIFDYGCYRIGIRQPVICKSRSKVISLTLKENKEKSEKRLAKKKYNLEELRDLESKLVLITGRNAPNRMKVELFLDVSTVSLKGGGGIYPPPPLVSISPPPQICPPLEKFLPTALYVYIANIPLLAYRFPSNIATYVCSYSRQSCAEVKSISISYLGDPWAQLVALLVYEVMKTKISSFFFSYVQTFHSVCHIAELLINLQQVGNVKYTGWILQVPCSHEIEIIDSLQNQAKKMEVELDNWKDSVHNARQEFYELNYYTTVQLLTLRRELSMERTQSDVAPNVLFLLQSISSEVTSVNIQEVVTNVVTCAPPKYLPPQSTIQSETAKAQMFHQETEEAVFGDYPKKRKTFSDMPELKEEDLTEDEMKTLTYVVRSLDCSKFLVLKAFEEFRGEVMDRYDYREWCNENLDHFNFEDEIASDSEDEDDAMSMSSSDSELENTDHQNFVYSAGA